MSQRNRDFADQLVTLFVVAFFVFAAIYFVGKEFDAFGYADSGREHHEKSDDWRIFGFVFERADTVAQWVVMFFTIIAAGLLWGTLREANKTNAYAISAANAAIEANEISRLVGKVQSRAYIHADKINHGMNAVSNKDGSNLRVQIELVAKNSGSTPAYNIEALYDIAISDDEGVVEYNLLEEGQIMKSGLGFMPPGGVQKFRFGRVWEVQDADSVLQFKERYVRFIFAFRFLDEFGDLRDSSITSGTFQILDGTTPVFVRDTLEYQSGQH